MTFLLTFIMLLNVKILVSQGKVCSPLVTSLTPYNGLCQTDVQCITRQCTNKHCLCRNNYSYDPCTATCVPNCDSTLTDPKGIIALPDYFYGSTHSCKWTIVGPSGSYVVISFTHVDFNPARPRDSQSLIKYEADGMERLIYFSDSTNNTTISSKSSTLKVEILQRNAYDWFSGVYRIFGANQIITETFGVIVSPGYPNEYARSSYSWTYFGNISIVITLLFKKLEDPHDKITIYNGSQSSYPTVSMNLNSPIKISNSVGLRITFTTDGSVEYQGFYITYYMQELTYGKVCSLNISRMCKGPDMVCRYDKIGDSRCLCPEGQYHHESQCLTAMLYDFQILTLEAKLVLLNGGCFTEHNITWSSLDDPLDHHELYTNAFTNFLLTNLTPGHEYVVGVVSTLKTDDYVDESPVKTNLKFFIVPAEPGEVLEEESNLNTPPYVLKFKASEGLVDHYNVTLVSDTQVLNYQIQEAELITSDLTADTLYNYTITAFNKLGNESTTFSGNVTTGPAQNIKTSLVVIMLISAGVLGIICIVIIAVIFIRCKRLRREAKTELILESMPVQYRIDTARTYSGLPTKSNNDVNKKESGHGYEGLQFRQENQEDKNELNDELYMNAAAVNEATEDGLFYEELP